jgi:hypothetical protein
MFLNTHQWLDIEDDRFYRLASAALRKHTCARREIVLHDRAIVEGLRAEIARRPHMQRMLAGTAGSR